MSNDHPSPSLTQNRVRVFRILQWSGFADILLAGVVGYVLYTDPALRPFIWIAAVLALMGLAMIVICGVLARRYGTPRRDSVVQRTDR